MIWLRCVQLYETVKPPFSIKFMPWDFEREHNFPLIELSLNRGMKTSWASTLWAPLRARNILLRSLPRYQVLYQASQLRPYTLEDIMNTNESIIHKAADITEQKLLVNLYIYASDQIIISLFLIDITSLKNFRGNLNWKNPKNISFWPKFYRTPPPLWKRALPTKTSVFCT